MSRAGADTPVSAPVRRRRRFTLARREELVGYSFVAPQVLGYFLVTIVPVILVIWYSFNDFKALAGRFEFTGLDNYVRLTQDPRLPEVLQATFLFVVLLVPAGIGTALVLAWLINRRIPTINLFRTIYFSPALVSLTAWVVIWQFVFLPDGLVNAVLGFLHIEGPNWLRQPFAAMVVVVLAQLFKGVGINMLIFLAAFQSIPQEIYEAARVDGARPRQILRRITLPMLAPEILMVTILMVIGAFKVFAQIQILTQGGPGFSTTTLAYYIYRAAFGNADFGYAGALSVLLFVVMFIVVGGLWVLRKRFVYHEQS